ncbi:uncharacterized protein LOC121796786 [Salvia splendens]|uniref:uncharacterized protein LOC121796786 n=1 Tax=Salvia splendens TaxID=180675 RepID=UPI001C25F369|nr:uncharacterized protein LOC121796786 [Salvia splendens]
MGFSDKWLRLIGNCISSCWFSVLINGSVAGFFKSSRGLRQGDPISPSLFILAADYLSRLLDHLIIGREEMMYRTARYTMGISHLAYADDIMVFSQAKTSSLLQLTDCLSHYMKVSGQKVNVGKSCFYLDKKHAAWAREVREVSRFQQGSLPFTYLGSPIFKGWKKTNEGGLGIRSLADSVEAFSLKMWWRFREQDSLWAREQVRWVVGEGNINFWFDSWVTNYPLREEEGLPEEVVERILQIPIDNGVRDRGRWKLSRNGEFSTASAWELVRSRAERNECVHREKRFDIESVIKKVNSQLRNLVLAKVISPDQWRGCFPRLDVMCGVEQVVRRGKVGRVQWRPPDSGWMKLNVDGAFSLELKRAGGGGVVRDQEGKIVVAFSTGLERNSGLEAEVGAVLAGVILAKRHTSRLLIESDADRVVRWLSTDQLDPAEVCSELRRIRKELQGLEWRMSHIYREGNKAADFLAGIGVLTEEKREYTKSSPPLVLGPCADWISLVSPISGFDRGYLCCLWLEWSAMMAREMMDRRFAAGSDTRVYNLLLVQTQEYTI